MPGQAVHLWWGRRGRQDSASLLYLVCMQTDAKLDLGAEELLSDFWSYDPSSATWTMLLRTSNAPSARAQHGLVSVNDMLYLYGGRSASGRYSTARALILKSRILGPDSSRAFVFGLYIFLNQDILFCYIFFFFYISLVFSTFSW